jgi:hypothetical protein
MDKSKISLCGDGDTECDMGSMKVREERTRQWVYYPYDHRAVGRLLVFNGPDKARWNSRRWFRPSV